MEEEGRAGDKRHSTGLNHARVGAVICLSWERKVNLTPQFSELLYYFLNGGHRLKYSVYQSWSANLRRWAALAGVEHPEDLSAGSTRKAWEAWLIESGWSLSRILASQGHDMNTSMKHYYNNDVTPEERIKHERNDAGMGLSEYLSLLSEQLRSESEIQNLKIRIYKYLNII